MDKKSDHYTSPTNYRDLDGNMRTFTYIDHDKKTKVGLLKMEDKDIETLKHDIKIGIDQKIEELLSLPAVALLKSTQGEELYSGFINRDIEKGITWEKDIVRGACRVNEVLLYNMFLLTWRNTVKEQNWFTDLDHEAMLKGEWKELM